MGFITATKIISQATTCNTWALTNMIGEIEEFNVGGGYAFWVCLSINKKVFYCHFNTPLGLLLPF